MELITFLICYPLVKYIVVDTESKLILKLITINNEVLMNF